MELTGSFPVSAPALPRRTLASSAKLAALRRTLETLVGETRVRDLTQSDLTWMLKTALSDLTKAELESATWHDRIRDAFARFEWQRTFISDKTTADELSAAIDPENHGRAQTRLTLGDGSPQLILDKIMTIKWHAEFAALSLGENSFAYHQFANSLTTLLSPSRETADNRDIAVRAMRQHSRLTGEAVCLWAWNHDQPDLVNAPEDPARRSARRHDAPLESPLSVVVEERGQEPDPAKDQSFMIRVRALREAGASPFQNPLALERSEFLPKDAAMYLLDWAERESQKAIDYLCASAAASQTPKATTKAQQRLIEQMTDACRALVRLSEHTDPDVADIALIRATDLAHALIGHISAEDFTCTIWKPVPIPVSLAEKFASSLTLFDALALEDRSPPLGWPETLIAAVQAQKPRHDDECARFLKTCNTADLSSEQFKNLTLLISHERVDLDQEKFWPVRRSLHTYIASLPARLRFELQQKGPMHETPALMYGLSQCTDLWRAYACCSDLVE